MAAPRSIFGALVRWFLSRRVTPHLIVSIGYEGRTPDELTALLKERGVTTLVDVRLNAVSRRPGMSKSALRDAVEREGIRYQHLRHLGNPKENRAGFSQPDVTAAAAKLRLLLAGADAQRDLQELAALVTVGPVAVLCYERDHGRCHRHVVIEQLNDLVGDHLVEAV